MRDSWCEGYDCTKCYKYLNCWSCAKADVENNKTCGELKLRKHRVQCFVCDMEHPDTDSACSCDTVKSCLEETTHG